MKKFVKTILCWILIGIVFVIIKNFIKNGFSGLVFNDYLREEFIIGIGTAVVVGLFFEYKKK